MHRFVEHTGELELELEGPSREAVLGEALAALRELVGDGEAGPQVVREIHAAGPDDAALLAAWIEELLFLVETDAFVPEAVERVTIADGIRATVLGRRGRPRHLVKAVTHHDLALVRQGGRWRGRCVLDV